MISVSYREAARYRRDRSEKIPDSKIAPKKFWDLQLITVSIEGKIF